jgi:hypothetical protein
MRKDKAVEALLEGRRVLIVKLVAHRFKEVCNKARKVVGVVNLYEVQCSDGKAPTVQLWCPRDILSLEDAIKRCPCGLKPGQWLFVEFELMEANTYDAINGVLIRASVVLPFEG